MAQVEQRSRFRRLRLYHDRGDFSRTADRGIKCVPVFEHGASPRQNMASTEFRTESGRCEAEADRQRKHNQQVGSRPECHAGSQEFGHALDAGQCLRDRPRCWQSAPPLSPPINNRSPCRNQRQHHDQAHAHAQRSNDAKIADDLNRREEVRQQADHRRDGGQCERDRHVTQAGLRRLQDRTTGGPLFSVVRDDLDCVVNGQTDHDDGHQSGD